MPTTLQNKATRILDLVADAIVESIRESGPLGAPAGALYAALMHQGWTLKQFDKLMIMLTLERRVRKSGHVYFAV